MQVFDAALTPGSVGLDDDFRIARRRKLKATAFECAAQFTEIVNGTIEYQREPKFAINHGLGRTRAEVDNGQSSMTKRERPITKNARIVGAARRQCVLHPRDRSHIRHLSVETQFAVNAAHGCSWIRGLNLASIALQCQSVYFTKVVGKPITNERINEREGKMNPLESIWGTIISGLVLTLVLAGIVALIV